MKRNLVPAVMFTISALTLASCSNSDDNGFESAGTPAETTVEQAQETNDRGAVEVALGEPVTLEDETGTPIINSELDATGCNAVSYDEIPNFAAEGLTGEIRQVLFKADVEVETYEYPQWLWSSDFYYANDDGEVSQNIQVNSLHSELVNPCEGASQIIDLPPNSKATGAITLSIPIGSEQGGPTVIGYAVNGNRAEWRLPDGWADELGEPDFIQ